LPLFFSLLFSQVSPKTYYFVSSGLGFLYHPQLVMRRQRRNLVLKDSHRLLNQIPWKKTKGRQGLSGMFNCKLLWVVQNLKYSWFIRTITNMLLHASRFSQSSSGSLSINGKGDLEPVRPSFMDYCSFLFERINCYLYLYYFSVLNFFCFFLLLSAIRRQLLQVRLVEGLELTSPLLVLRYYLRLYFLILSY